MFEFKEKYKKELEEILDSFVDHFGLEGVEYSIAESSYDSQDGEENYLQVQIDGEELGVLIGYYGRNLRALQRIVGLMMNRKFREELNEGEFIRVVVDVSDYRKNREDHLTSMADQARENVLASGESFDLPSMSSFERRVIHTHLSSYEDVITESYGEGKNRYVRVSLKCEDSEE